MIKNLHDIDKIFKEGLEDHREPVPSSVWESLNNDLDKKQAAHYREKYFRLKKLAVLLLLLVAFSGTYLFYFYPSAQKDSSIAAKKANPVINAKDSTASSSVAVNKNTRSANNRPPIRTVTANQQTVIESGKENESMQSTTNGVVIINPEHTNSNAQKITVEKTVNHFQKLSTDDIAAEKNIPSTANPSSIHSANTDITKGLPLKKESNKYNAAAETNTYVNRKDEYIHQHQPITKNDFVAASTDKVPQINAFDNGATAATAWLLEPFIPAGLSAEVPSPGSVKPTHAIPLSDSVAENVQEQIAKLRAKNNAMSIHRFSFMVFGTPNHSFIRLENDWRLAGPGYDKNEALRSEQQGSSFSAGILVNYGLSGYLTIQSGLVFSSATTSIAPKTIYAKSDVNGHTRYELNCSSGYAYFAPKGSQPAVGDSIKISGANISISYIGVPVSINYTIKTGKFLIKPGVGFSLNFLTGNHSATNFNLNTGKEQESTTISGLKNSYLDGSLGLGIEYMLNRRISVGIRPLLRWALTSINRNTPVKSYQNYTSLETGLKINL